MKASVTLQDIALVQMQDGTIGATIEYPGFSNRRNAERAAQRDLRALSTPLLSCTIYCGQEAADLDIGDTFKLEWPEYHGGAIIMRVTGMAFGDGRTDRIRIDCVQDVFEAPQEALLSEDRGSLWSNPSTPPGAIANDPADEELDAIGVGQIAVEMPYRELVDFVGQRDIDEFLSETPDVGFVLTSGRRPTTGGNAINALIHVDVGSGYTQQGTAQFSPYARLAEGIGFLTTELTVTAAQDLGQVRIGSVAQIDQELVRVDAISGSTVTVGRGVLDTVPQPHDSGTSILFWQDFAGSDEEEYTDGETINVKLQPRNNSGAAPLASVVAMSVAFNSRVMRPYPPGNVQVNGVAYPETVEAGDGEPVEFKAYYPFGLGASARFMAVQGPYNQTQQTELSWHLGDSAGEVSFEADFDIPDAFSWLVPVDVAGYSATADGVTIALPCQYMYEYNSILGYVLRIQRVNSTYRTVFKSSNARDFDEYALPEITEDGPWDFQIPVYIQEVDGEFVLVTRCSMTGGDNDYYLQTSSDGASWSSPILLDFGSNWISIDTTNPIWGSNGGKLRKTISIAKGGSTYVLSTENAETYYSTDLASWTKSDLEAQVDALISDGSAVCAAVTPGDLTVRIHRSTNGSSWTQVSNLAISNANQIDRGIQISGGFVFCGAPGFYRSTDDGETWSRLAHITAAPRRWLSTQYKDGVFWSAIIQNTYDIPVLYWSDDDGETWNLGSSGEVLPITITWSHRDRLQQTGTVLEDTTQGNIGPEPGTTYTLQIRDEENELVVNQPGLVTPFWSEPAGLLGEGIYTVTLWSVRDGYASWQAHSFTFAKEEPES